MPHLKVLGDPFQGHLPLLQLPHELPQLGQLLSTVPTLLLTCVFYRKCTVARGLGSASGRGSHNTTPQLGQDCLGSRWPQDRNRSGPAVSVSWAVSMTFSTIRLSVSWVRLVMRVIFLQKGQRTPLMLLARRCSRHGWQMVWSPCRSLGRTGSSVKDSMQMGHCSTSPRASRFR